MSQVIINIAIITGSTRPGRNSLAVSNWILSIASNYGGASYELVDIADFNLPLLDEPLSASASARMGKDYSKPHTKKWSEAISKFDGYLFIVPEYNFGISAALKNALDFLYVEWNNKAAGFVSYGTNGGVRATAQLRQVLAELKIATITPEVNFSLHSDFEHFTDFKPSDNHRPHVEAMVDQLVSWSSALKDLRNTANV